MKNKKKLLKKFIVKESFKSNLNNLPAAIAAILNYTDIKNLKESFFYNLKTPQGRGDISKITF